MSRPAKSKQAKAPPADNLVVALQVAVRDRESTLPLATRHTVVATAADSFWRALNDAHGFAVPCPARPATIEFDVLPDELRQLAIAFGCALAMREIDQACAAFGTLYTGLLPPAHRSKHGIFYTPPVVADWLLKRSEQAGVDWLTARVVDPACGFGIFLVQAAQRIATALRDLDPALVIQNVNARLRGWDQDPFAAWMAQLLVEAALLPLVAASGKRVTDVTQQRDSLRSQEQGEFDLVVGNPPFGKMKSETWLQRLFSRSLFGHPNLYGLFTDLAVKLAKRGGVVAFVKPASFLAGEYFKNLRAVLAREAPPASIDFVDARKGVFDDVLQETVLAVYRKGAKAKRAETSVIAAFEPTRLKVEASGHFTLPANETAPWMLARRPASNGLAERLGAMETRLADWGYSVSTGPLVWNRHKEKLKDRPSKKRVPIVWAEAVLASGKFKWGAEKRGHLPWYEHAGAKDPNVVQRGCVLLQRTTAKEQARRLIAAEMTQSFVKKHGGAAVENHLNMLLPRDAAPAIKPKVLAAFLNTEAADAAFRCISGSVAVSAFELESMPLPSVKAMSRFAQMVAKRASKDALEKEAHRLYGSEVA